MEGGSCSRHEEEEEVVFGMSAHVLHRGDVNGEDITGWKEEHKLVEEEWKNVVEIAPTHVGTPAQPVSRPPITFTEAFDHYSTLNLSEQSSRIRPCIQRNGFSALCYSFCNSKLHESLCAQRDFIFTLALVKFDNESDVCNRILISVYKGITRNKIDCPRYGRHWEQIGFQGADPSTDLRGCGMLGLVTLLHFITSKQTSTLSSIIYQLSQDEMQNFPFSVMSINVTRIALQVLREGKLNKECNRRLKSSRKSSRYTEEGDVPCVVYEVFQQMYVSVYTRIYNIWKNEYKTMADSGYVMKDVETAALKNSARILDNPTHNTTLQGDLAIATEQGKMEFLGVDEL